ncbi:exonuclease SbcC [Candidatus Caldarchaeum subterraneum]|uniref:Exonuclease SbcC n=1 Tax=Caldiarchaeum subterraneum TaxID=311458 RepID=E6N6R8_CALS0|nr:exonuclease SbcC [Candidatus Caldarchaeum subterraneum]BAJ50797.1 exonuclease SbcC [Candidatus Caldarchaeum subterraneum]
MIRRVRLFNFLSHRDTEISLGDGLTVFIGRNGAGKSSVVDAIVYALYGRHTRGQNANIVHDGGGAQEGRVELDFELNRKLYKVMRRFDNKGNLKEASIREDGKLLATSERGVDRRVSDIVSGLLGMNYERMRSSVVIQQGEVDAILRADPKELKELFDDLLGLSAFEQAYARMKEVLECFEERVRLMVRRSVDELLLVEQELEKLRRLLTEGKEKEVELEKELERLRNEHQELSEGIEKLEGLHRLFGEVRSSLEALKGLVRRELADLEEEVGRIERATKVLVLREEIEKRITRVDELRVEISRLDEKERALQRQLREIGGELARLPTGAGARTLEELRNEARTRAERLRDDAVELGKAVALGAETLGLANRVELDVKGVVELVSEAHGSALASRAAELVTKRDAIKAEIEETNRRRREANKEIYELGTINGQDVQRLRNKVLAAEQLLREVGGEPGVAALKARLEGLRERAAKLEKVKVPIELDVAELQGVAEVLPADVAELLSRIRTGIKRLRDDGYSAGDVVQLERLKLRKDKLSREIGSKEKELEKLREDMQKAEKEIGELERVREVLRKAREFRDLMRKMRELVYHREGPVLMSLRSWVYERVSERAGEYLDTFESPVSDIRIEEERTGRGSRVVFRCFYQGREVSWERLSGGEKVVLALALRLAIGDALGAQRLGFFVLDEPTVHLDAEKRRRLREVLTRLGRKMPQVIVITHDEEVFEGAEARVLRFELGRGATIVSEVESSPSLSAITRN